MGNLAQRPDKRKRGLGMQAAFDSRLVADELRRYQKFAKAR
jgi:hypothetical protein